MFLNNNNGANLFCQQLGFGSGTIRPESKSKQVSLPADGIRIGLCNDGDTWGSCTGHCNDLSVGGDSADCSNCQTGENAGIKIDCSTGMKIC